MSFTIRARLTALYFLVLAASFTAFFWICDYGFQKSISTAVNDASKRNLDTLKRVLERHISQGTPQLSQELTRVSDLWESGAIFQVAGPDGRWIYRAPSFLSQHPPLQPLRGEGVSFQTTNLSALQYRVARQQIALDGNVYLVDAAVPTEPFDQALDSFRLMEKRFLPLLVVLASLLGYWLSGRALAPVNRIIESAERVGVRNLSRRLEVPRAKDELRRLTEQLNAMLDRIEVSVKRITQFTADASHDLRTPLALIRTNAELALRRTRSDGEYRETLARILSTSEETTELIEQLLLLARADANGAQLKLEPTTLSPVLLAVAQNANLLSAGKGLTFSQSIVSSTDSLFANQPALERLFMTVLDNAIKYTPAGGHVSLGLRLENSEAIIEVTDTGIGIAEKDLPHVFERFYRADQARSRETRGSGLGLSIAKWIAETHKGSIELQSQLGQGTRVTIRLPLAVELSTSSPDAPQFQELPLNLA
ncbi:MAG TPA: ATP-binding protein [Candidatus Sulfotelmatobacter sp.]|jgi:heavy metal sensor kinase|nr:ATP-binding protein [Candidatus Sulfotelmatobacter sp.]